MSSLQNDPLFSLIKSLTQSEKRTFRLYATRLQSGEEGAGEQRKFLQLFDALDKMSDYQEEVLFKKLDDSIQKKHLPNLKRHLYKQILISLRLVYIHKNIDIEIREQIDFARILYGKGMYMQALKLLERIKNIANEHHQDVLHLEILEFQKLIEARHITRSRKVEGKMEMLLEESSLRSHVSYSNSLLFNFNIQVHGWYIQHGHARTPHDIEALDAFWNANNPEVIEDRSPTFFEKANLYQARMWYYYIRLDMQQCRKWADQCVHLFSAYNPMRQKDPDLYMRSLYYLLTTLYFLKEKKEFSKYLKEFEAFVDSQADNLNANSRTIAFVYLNLSRINEVLLNNDFEKGVQQISEIEKELEQFEQYSDIHRTLLFYYKFAYLHFACGNYNKALDYLNKIILLKHGYLREDLHHNARLLFLICHFELGNYDLLHYHITSVQRAFAHAKDLSQVQLLTLQLLRKLSNSAPAEIKPALEQFKDKMTELSVQPQEQKALLYLDLMGWTNSRLRNCTLNEWAKKK